ncbi:ECF transporter S component [Lachnospiraceae bacterium LCP25S3_G4]
MNNEVTRDASSHAKTLGMVQVALFSAIIVILAFTPFLGYIPLGFTRATIIHIPVIIGSLMLGPKKGAILGGVFGLTSLINNTMNPTVTSFVFSPFYSLGEIHGGIGSIIICMIPRILVGVIPFFVYRFVLKVTKCSNTNTTFALGAAGLAGALTNTLLVMNLIFVFFKDTYASVNNVASDAVYKFILSIIGINGIPEAIVAAVIVICVGRILVKTKYNFN